MFFSSTAIKLTIATAVIVLISLGLTQGAIRAQEGQAGTTLTTTVTAEGSSTGAAQWRIEKSVTPNAWNLFAGDTGTSRYTVTVTKEGGGGGTGLVRGEVCAANEGERATEGLTIFLVVQYKTGSGQFQDLVSAPVSTASKPVLGPGESWCYPYEVTFAPVEGAVYRAKSVVTITNHSGYLGEPFGPETKADFSLSGSSSPAGETVTVMDSNGQSWTFSESGSVSYDHTFTCDGATQNYTAYNTATIQETGQAAEAAVTVNCFQLSVEKDAHTTVTVQPEWSLEKTVEPDSWGLFQGDSATSQYTVTALKEEGSGGMTFEVSGSIWVHNPAPRPATIVGVSDVISPDIPAAVDCGVAFPYDLPGGATLQCAYQAMLPDETPRTNTATATLQNRAFDASGNSSPSGTTGYSGEAYVDFSQATYVEQDSTITVVDSNGQSWTFAESGSVTYEHTFYCDAPGVYDMENVATIEESGRTATATVVVNCFDLQVSKDAAASGGITYEWFIDKTVTPDYWELFVGDSGTSQYTIYAFKEESSYSDGFFVEGTIRITNASPLDATLLDVTDIISPDLPVEVDCGVTFPFVLLSGSSLQCTYQTELPDGADRVNTAAVTLQNFDYDYLGTPYTGGTTDFTAQAAVVFGGAGGSSIEVVDSNGMSWVFSDSDSVTYEHTFTCTEPGAFEYDNTATIVETGESVSATVFVECFALDVFKDAEAVMTETYDWTIAKSADQSQLVLSPDQTAPVNYAVTLDATRTATGAVEGTIWVYNASPLEALLLDVTDVIAPDLVASVDCGVTFPYLLGGYDALECTYEGAVPDATERVNTATATLQNHAYDFLKNPAPGGTTDFIGQADVIFTSGQPGGVIDACVEVTDSLAGFLGVVCAEPDALPFTFTYTHQVGPYPVCGDYVVDNVASYVTLDTGQSGSAQWTVNVEVPCVSDGDGCTSTIGYWKNHAGLGPQEDVVSDLLPIWLGTPGGAESIKVTSAEQAVDILNMKLGNPSNGITKLYAQLLAAKLNVARGADGTVIAAAVTAADAFLSDYGWQDWRSLTSQQQETVLSWMTAFDAFNNGIIGPGHCDNVPEVNVPEVRVKKK